MPRLYLRFYLALLVSLIVFALAATLLLHRTGGPVAHAAQTLARLVQNALPPADAPAADQQAALARLASGLNADITLLASDRSRIAVVGRPQSLEQADKLRPAWLIHLPDGRRLLASIPIGFGPPAHIVLLMLVSLALAVSLASYPLIRRLAKRLERLQAGVESLGTGDLGARVVVEGRDEVARLAASFNQAAERIEALMGAHKTLLANASHELRTPLARIRLAVEMMPDAIAPKRRAGLEQDIAELDLLIDEILLASRLDAVAEQVLQEDVDLLALAAEECARYQAVQLDGMPSVVRGDPRLLRRLLRNLLENAARHGVAPTEVRLVVGAGTVEIIVTDAGPGVPAAECERVFEPFYRRSHTGSYTGTGLGLALVRQIARLHGGEACCVASEGRGRFVVSLPIVSAVAEQGEPPGQG